MALISCKECGAKISDSAKSCPSCGNPNLQQEKTKGCSNTLIAIGVIILLLFIIGQYNQSSDVDSSTADTNALEAIDTSTVKQGTVNVKKLSAEERKGNIEKLRNMFLDSGIDVKVSVYGKNNETLELKNVVFDDVWFRKFETAGMFDNFHNLGFKEIILNNEYDYRKSISY